MKSYEFFEIYSKLSSEDKLSIDEKVSEINELERLIDEGKKTVKNLAPERQDAMRFEAGHYYENHDLERVEIAENEHAVVDGTLAEHDEERRRRIFKDFPGDIEDLLAPEISALKSEAIKTINSKKPPRPKR